MTTNDWIGTIVTVVVFFLMLGLYIYVLIPKNKGMEENKNIPIDDEQVNTGE
jgi:cytochrome c oxidase cbb3-type subunit 4